jgi:hypothetical protein
MPRKIAAAIAGPRKKRTTPGGAARKIALKKAGHEK